MWHQAGLSRQRDTLRRGTDKRAADTQNAVTFGYFGHMTMFEGGSVPPILVRHRLRIAREYAGLEQDELAELIGVARNTVGNAEKGRHKVRKITLNAWALHCGVPLSWIENGSSA